MASKLDKAENVVGKISTWLNWIAIAGFVFMAALTVADVIGAKLFRKPILWSFDITALLGLVLLTFAMAQTHLLKGHIEIEFFTEKLSKKAQKIIAVFANLVGVIFFVFVTWQMTDFAILLLKSHRVTSVGSTPLYPFAFGAAFCFFITLLVLILQFYKSIVEAVRK